MAVELAIAAPAVIAMILLVVGLGRVSYARQLVDAAAASAGRAAALSATPGQAQATAIQAAAATTGQGRVSCARTQVLVDVTRFRPGGRVVTTVRCTTSLAGLTLAGMPGSVTLTSTASTPLETYRQYVGITP